MKIHVNLATRPFRRDRPILVAGGAIASLLVISLAWFVYTAWQDSRDVERARTSIARLNSQIKRVASDQSKVDAEMRLPANSIVLDRSVLLNSLIRRKGISWTRIFGDLETVLPANVRITAIRPQLDGRGHVRLEMTVAAAAQEPVIDFMAKLEGSELFGQTAATAITPPSQNDPNYHYRVMVNYAQKLD